LVYEGRRGSGRLASEKSTTSLCSRPASRPPRCTNMCDRFVLLFRQPHAQYTLYALSRPQIPPSSKCHPGRNSQNPPIGIGSVSREFVILSDEVLTRHRCVGWTASPLLQAGGLTDGKSHPHALHLTVRTPMDRRVLQAIAGLHVLLCLALAACSQTRRLSHHRCLRPPAS